MGDARADRRASVVQVLPCDALGGTEQMVAALVERLDRNRIDVTLATLASPGPISARVQAAGIPVHSLGGSGFAAATWRLGALVRRERPDVVVAYGLRATIAGRIIARSIGGTRTFVSGVRGLHVTDIEDVESGRSRAILRLERLLSPLVDVYDCNSRGALELLASAGVPRERLRYIPNGIDVQAWPAAKGGDDGPVTIVCVARLTPIKRHPILLTATHELVSRGRNVRLVLVGDGPARGELERLSDELGLAGVVRFAGQRNQAGVQEDLAAADIFSLASAWEGMPGGVMEGMASGLPVVGTDVNGIADLVVPGESGTLVPPGRPDALADALDALVNDAELRRRLGEAGRARMAGEFSLDTMVAAKQDLYLELAAVGA